MKIKLSVIMLCASLAGCAGSSVNTGACTNLISGAGGLLKFCQTDNKINITETGMEEKGEYSKARIIDDPETLSALTRQITLHSKYEKSRRLVTHACVVKGDTYVNMRVSDIRRILESAPQNSEKFSGLAKRSLTQ